MIAFAPKNDRRPWQGAAGHDNRFTPDDTTHRAQEWPHAVRRLNVIRQRHDLHRLADACGRIALALEARR
jgi:hypothetical protein